MVPARTPVTRRQSFPHAFIMPAPVRRFWRPSWSRARSALHAGVSKPPRRAIVKADLHEPDALPIAPAEHGGIPPRLPLGLCGKQERIDAALACRFEELLRVHAREPLLGTGVKEQERRHETCGAGHWMTPLGSSSSRSAAPDRPICASRSLVSDWSRCTIPCSKASRATSISPSGGPG